MDIEKARFNMVEQQIRTWEVLDPEVLDLLFKIKREDFVPAAYKELAFADLSIPLGKGQSMWSPKIEARAVQELQVKKSDVVLEVGTGSGYMTALLAARAQQVYSVEILPELAALARDNLARAGVMNATVEQGDGARGWTAHAPYDVILIGGSMPFLPEELLRQLRVGGRLFAFVGESPAMPARLVTCVAEGEYQTVNLFEYDVPRLANAPEPERFVF